MTIHNEWKRQVENPNCKEHPLSLPPSPPSLLDLHTTCSTPVLRSSHHIPTSLTFPQRYIYRLRGLGAGSKFQQTHVDLILRVGLSLWLWLCRALSCHSDVRFRMITPLLCTALLYRDHWPLAIYNFVFLNQWHIRTSYGYGVLSIWFRNDTQENWWCKEASGAYNHITYHIRSSFLKDRVGISLVATVKALVPLPMLPPIPTSSKNWRTGPMTDMLLHFGHIVDPEDRT